MRELFLVLSNLMHSISFSRKIKVRENASDAKQTSLTVPGLDQTTWIEITALLESHQFEQMAEIIREIQAASEKYGDTEMTRLLDAAYQICLTAGQYHSEIAFYKQAYEGAIIRENELQKQVEAISNLVNSEVSSGETKLNTFKEDIPDTDGFFISTEKELPSVEGSDINSEFPEEQMKEIEDKPTLVVYFLGRFRVYHDNKLVAGRMNGKGSAILKYLIVNRKYPIAKEVLMENFWPGASPDVARNNLNVAIYNLRQTLRAIRPDFSHVLFRDDRYLLNPELQIWVDSEEFLERFKTAQDLDRRGDLNGAVREYRAAEALYQGEFLEEDRYEDWIISLRQSHHDYYLNLLENLSRYYYDQKDYDTCTIICGKIIAVEPGREDLHQRLMLCYHHQRQRYLALRQYHLCVEALERDFGVGPSKPTLELYERICRV